MLTLFLVCHAELNAILNKNVASVKNCIIYVALFPCNECAKLIIQSGLREIVYMSDKYHDSPEMEASRKLLNLAGVKYRYHTIFDLITAPALITAPSLLILLFSLNIAHLTIFFLTFYFIFTYYRPLDDLCGREQIYVSAPGAY